jgi:exopolyphosphatase / guanosine-5'-triphosphate,3'-diphosphate pyrophosphatase
LISLNFAAVDIGSNAVRLLICEIIEKHNTVEFKKKLFVRVPLRLGMNAFVQQNISEEKINDLLKLMIAFKNLIEVYRPKDLMICATAAMREASNGMEIVKTIKAQTGLKVEIIEGKKEAEIIYANHVAETLNSNGTYLYIDVGGGSTELTLFSEGKLQGSHSFSIGTIRILFERDTPERWDELKNWIKANVQGKKIVGIGTGGNINKISRLIGKKESKSISYEEIKNTHDYLNSLTIDQLIHDVGLNEDRADVIVPAGKIFLTIMKWANIDEIYVPRIGLADGMVHYLYEKYQAKT